MRVLALLLALASTFLFTTAQSKFLICILMLHYFCIFHLSDVACGKSTAKNVTVDGGDSFSFKTQRAKFYRGNSKCVVTYEVRWLWAFSLIMNISKLGSSCAEMQFSCSRVNIINKDRKRCSQGDKLIIQSGFTKT